MNLYEINSAILELLDEETGEIANAESFENLMMAREEKIENIALYIKNLESNAEQIKAEEKSLKSRRESAENKAENLRAYLATALGDGQKFETPRVKLSWRKSESVKILIPEEDFIEWAKKCNDGLLSYKEPTINKAEIKKRLNAGEVITAATLLQSNNLQIK